MRAKTLSSYISKAVVHPAKRRGRNWKRMSLEEWDAASKLKLRGAKLQPRSYEMIRKKVRAL